jgi:ketosteroid isomerase-like protein
VTKYNTFVLKHGENGLESNGASEEETLANEMILSLERGAIERSRRGDPWGWAEISADQIIYVDPDLTSPIEGLEAYKKHLKSFEGTGNGPAAEFIAPRVVVMGEAAVLTYITPETGSAGQTFRNVTAVYFRLNGQWRIAHVHWSYLGHQLPKRVEVPVPVQSPPDQYGGVLGEVMALESAAMERWRKGDPWGFIELSTPDVTYFDTGTTRRLDGVEVLRAEYAKREGQIYYDVMDFIDPKALVHGDVAVLVYRFFSTRLNPDGSILSRVPWNCSEVFARIDGAWKIVHTHWSFITGEKR